jgi:outer membrane protein OmpA-like peptidoglycan-associated protein
MPPPSTALTVATVTFAGQSAEISDAAKADLNRVAKNLTGVRQIEVRAYASGSDPVESRKIALARALVVRSYLIDQNVKTRIEISGASGGGERVDIMTSN